MDDRQVFPGLCNLSKNCERWGINALLKCLSIAETSIEVADSVRGKDVFIIQTGSG